MIFIVVIVIVFYVIEKKKLLENTNYLYFCQIRIFVGRSSAPACGLCCNI
jgi:hypothetical protein